MVTGRKYPEPFQDRASFCMGLIIKPMVGSQLDYQKEQCVPNLADNIRQLSHSVLS